VPRTAWAVNSTFLAGGPSGRLAADPNLWGIFDANYYILKLYQFKGLSPPGATGSSQSEAACRIDALDAVWVTRSTRRRPGAGPNTPTKDVSSA
jgi:hypothetical protein